MTTEALRKLIKEYQLGLRDDTPWPLGGEFHPLPPEGGW
jgi:hypothetical protein